jgi:hypothetical protein
MFMLVPEHLSGIISASSSKAAASAGRAEIRN